MSLSQVRGRLFCRSIGYPNSILTQSNAEDMGWQKYFSFFGKEIWGAAPIRKIGGMPNLLLKGRKINCSQDKGYDPESILVRRLAMEGTLYILGFFVLRLGVPALLFLTIGELVRRHSSHTIVGGD